MNIVQEEQKKALLEIFSKHAIAGQTIKIQQDPLRPLQLEVVISQQGFNRRVPHQTAIMSLPVELQHLDDWCNGVGHF